MQADYFRLCYLLVEGGLYVDADDVCIGEDIGWLFDDGRLKLQPLCYDLGAEAMVAPSVFLCAQANNPGWIHYFNNNPLIAGRGHAVIEMALKQATDVLDTAYGDADLPEIQSTTGPGNLSKAVFALGEASDDVKSSLMVLRKWESFAISKWPLSYRSDTRNWRLSNGQRFYDEEAR